MLSKEEIEKAKEMLNKLKDYKVLVRGGFVEILTEEEKEAIETLLQYIQELEEIKGMKESIELAGMKVDDFYKAIRTCHQLEQENNKLNKMIDEMAKAWKQDDCRSIEEIKKYFEKKVDENDVKNKR